MQLRREELQQKLPDVKSLFFLDDFYDAAILGQADRAVDSQTKVVYSFSIIIRLYHNSGISSDAWADKINTEIVDYTDLIVLLYGIANGDERRAFWEYVARQNMVTWQGLHPAIAGVSFEKGRRNVVVYHYPRSIEILVADMASSEETDQDPVDMAIEYYETYIRSANLGPTTPFTYFPLDNFQLAVEEDEDEPDDNFRVPEDVSSEVIKIDGPKIPVDEATNDSSD